MGTCRAHGAARLNLWPHPAVLCAIDPSVNARPDRYRERSFLAREARNITLTARVITPRIQFGLPSPATNGPDAFPAASLSPLPEQIDFPLADHRSANTTAWFLAGSRRLLNGSNALIPAVPGQIRFLGSCRSGRTLRLRHWVRDWFTVMAETSSSTW